MTCSRILQRTGQVSGPEPGYDATSKIMSSCAAVLLKERQQIISYVNTKGGVFTTADAYATSSLFDELESRGINFKKVE